MISSFTILIKNIIACLSDYMSDCYEYSRIHTLRVTISSQVKEIVKVAQPVRNSPELSYSIVLKL